MMDCDELYQENIRLKADLRVALGLAKVYKKSSYELALEVEILKDDNVELRRTIERERDIYKTARVKDEAIVAKYQRQRDEAIESLK